MAIAVNANGTTERNGTVVTTCLPTGQFKTDNDGPHGDGQTPDNSRDITSLDIATMNARWNDRFDDPTYYSA
jgi:hypothetical protein